MSTCTTALPPPKVEPAKPEHRLASAADFRKRIKDEDCYEPPVYVILPKCGLEVLLRRPRPIAYTLFGEALPGIPEQGTDAAPSAEGQPKISAEDAAHIARWLAELWGKVFVQPTPARWPKKASGWRKW